MKLRTIDLKNLDERIKNCTIRVACDVENPLVGEFGATKIFGPQKGANKKQLDNLEIALTRYGDLIRAVTGLDVNNINEAGAAGGLGAAFIMLNAKLKRNRYGT